MNWSNLNSQPPKKQPPSQPRQFHQDRSLKSQPRQQLKLQSCERARGNFTREHLHHTPHASKPPQEQDKEILVFGAIEEVTLKRQTERLINLLTSICSLPQFNHQHLDNMKETVQAFGKELELLFSRYVQKFLAFSLPREKKEDFNKKVVLYIDETMKREFISIGNPSQTIRDSSNNSHDSYQSGKAGISLANSRAERVSPFQYQGDSAHKNSMSKIESSFNQVNRLLQKVSQPRFIRKSNMLSRHSRGQSSSIESLIERSADERRRLNTNSSNSKETLYAINRLLNE